MEQRNKVRGLAHRPQGRQGHAGRGSRPAGHRTGRVRAAGGGRHQRRHDRPERRPRRRHGPLLHGPGGRARRACASCSERSCREHRRHAEMTTDAAVAKVSIVGRRDPERAGLRGAHVRRARRRGHQHRDDLDLARSASPASSPSRRGDGRPGPPRAFALELPETVGLEPLAGAPRPPPGRAGRAPFVSRLERFARSTPRSGSCRLAGRGGSRRWAMAIADVQTAGRGRTGRAWQAPPGRRAAHVLRLPADATCRSPRRGAWPRSRPWPWRRRPRSSGLPTARSA